MENYIQKITESAEFIKKELDKKPDIAIILGSGLGQIGEELTNKKEIKYSNIPNFPLSTVSGHSGKIILGYLEDKYVLCMSGRFHYYEGYDMEQVTFPIRIFKMLGIDKMIVTNAAGGINETFNPGDIMIIKDHINMTGINPLRGKNYEEFGTRFPDMSFAYDKELINKTKQISDKLGIEVKEGVYAYMTGPSFETPSEIKALRTLGADAVGMSTFAETIIAVHAGIKVLGISIIVNMASGMTGKALSHSEITDVSNKANEKVLALLRGVITDVGK